MNQRQHEEVQASNQLGIKATKEQVMQARRKTTAKTSREAWFQFNFDALPRAPKLANAFVALVVALDLKINKQRYDRLPDWAKEYWVEVERDANPNPGGKE